MTKKNKPLPRSKYYLLQRIYQYILEKKTTVRRTDSWLWEQIHVGQNAVSGNITFLIKEGFLEEREDKIILPTAQTINLFQGLQEKLGNFQQDLTTPALLWIKGQVKAGQASPEELEVDLMEHSEPGSKVIPIPEYPIGSNVYALEVVGNSMDHEGLFEGDLVIVEEFKNYQFPKPNQLIVTKYIPLPGKKFRSDEDYYEPLGPTLKHVRETNKADGTKYYRLSWKNEVESNPYTIEAAQIFPIGKVIGIYRPITQ